MIPNKKKIIIDDGFPSSFLRYLVKEILILADRRSTVNPSLTSVQLSTNNKGAVVIEWAYDSNYDPENATDNTTDESRQVSVSKVFFVDFLYQNDEIGKGHLNHGLSTISAEPVNRTEKHPPSEISAQYASRKQCQGSYNGSPRRCFVCDRRSARW